MSAAFAKGAVLFDGTGSNYMVHASRREQPGQAEVHAKDTDIIYVLDGSTTFVTGGTLVDRKTTAPDEIRGTAVQDGDDRARSPRATSSSSRAARRTGSRRSTGRCSTTSSRCAEDHTQRGFARRAVASLALLPATAAPASPSLDRACSLGRPDAVIDLRTAEGVRLVNGQWRYSDTKIVEVDAKAPGPDLKPSGTPIKTYDYTPKAGAADFDDSRWEAHRSGSARRTPLDRASSASTGIASR